MTVLRELGQADDEWILDVLDRWEHCSRWSLRGRTPSPLLLRDVVGPETPFAQVAQLPTGQPVAVFHVDAVDPVSAFGHLGILADPSHRAEAGQALQELLPLAINLLSLRKLCLATTVDDLQVERYVDLGLRPVGRLVGAERRGVGSYVDVLAHELWREDVGT
jgi:hypothetical protein